MWLFPGRLGLHQTRKPICHIDPEMPEANHSQPCVSSRRTGSAGCGSRRTGHSRGTGGTSRSPRCCSTSGFAWAACAWPRGGAAGRAASAARSSPSPTRTRSQQTPTSRSAPHRPATSRFVLPESKAHAQPTRGFQPRSEVTLLLPCIWLANWHLRVCGLLPFPE